MPPLSFGVDAYAGCAPIAGLLKSSGRSFVCRYYANSSRKRLTVSEAKVLSSAGLKVVTVWEDGYPTKAAYFSYAKGVDDGASAYHDAMSLGQPNGSAIYFAVDFDATAAEITGVISDYFRGIADGFATISRGAPGYLIGVYGSGLTCSSILTQGLVKYSWLALATGWQGYSFGGWNIKQKPGEPVKGIPLDFDDATDDYGGFTIG
jgi:hypothetical protein